MGLFKRAINAVATPVIAARNSLDGNLESIGGDTYRAAKGAARDASNSEYAKAAGYIFPGANAASLFSVGYGALSPGINIAGGVGTSPALYSPEYREGAFARAKEVAASFGIPDSITNSVADVINSIFNSSNTETGGSNSFSSGEGGTYFSGSPATKQNLLYVGGALVVGFLLYKALK